MSAGLSLPDGYDLSGMSAYDLWLNYLSVGGNARSEFEVEAAALGLVQENSYEYTVVAQALNEHFLELGEDHPVSYDPAGSHQRR